MKTLKTATFLLAVFLGAAFLALYRVDQYRLFVQRMFTFFQGDRIRFVGKNFHLFPPDDVSIVICFAVAATLLTALFQPLPRLKAFYYLAASVLLFFVSNFLTTGLDSTAKVVECTACQDGIRSLHYNSLKYAVHFNLGLAAGVLPVLIAVLIKNYSLGNGARRSHTQATHGS